MTLTKVILPNKSFDNKRSIRSFDKVSKYFGKPKARPLQKEIIGILRDAIEDRDYKYVFMQMPTGDGKSVTAMSLAEYFRREHSQPYYLLSMDLGLTQQYLRDYPYLKEVKGRNNFQCALPNYQHLTCNKAPCAIKPSFRNKCSAIDECAYYSQRDVASLSLGTLSTPYYIDRCCPGEIFQKRFLTIRDEAHKLEKFYLGMYQETITTADYQACFPSADFPHHDDPSFWKNEIIQMIKVLDMEIEEAEAIEDMKSLERYAPILSKCQMLKYLFDTPDNVVIDIETTQKYKRSYALFRPVKANKIANKILSATSDHTIFMSATFLSIYDRMNQLGIDVDTDDVLYINKTRSEFPSSNRRLIVAPIGSMSWARRAKTIPKMIDFCNGAIDNHKGERGLIIVGSHAIRKTIYDSLTKMQEYPENLITHDSSNFKEQFEYFLDHPNKELTFITTRYEGLDFYGKLAEFLIYVNLPYAPPMDKQIAARLLLEQKQHIKLTGGTCGFEPDPVTDNCTKAAYCKGCKRWYDLQVAEAIQQGIGRIIRTPTDVGTIYILDSRFKDFLKKNGDMFLKYNREAIK